MNDQRRHRSAPCRLFELVSPSPVVRQRFPFEKIRIVRARFVHEQQRHLPMQIDILVIVPSILRRLDSVAHKHDRRVNIRCFRLALVIRHKLRQIFRLEGFPVRFGELEGGLRERLHSHHRHILEICPVVSRRLQTVERKLRRDVRRRAARFRGLPASRLRETSHARGSYPCQFPECQPATRPPFLAPLPSSPAPRPAWSFRKRRPMPAGRTNKPPHISSWRLLNLGRNYFFARSLSKFFSSLMNSCTSLKSMYTDANRTYATLSSFFSWCMIISPISVVVSSRSLASCTTPSISSTISSSFGVPTGLFSHAFSSPCKIFCRSKRSRRPSFLITMYGISSIRSYVVNRRLHFRHSRRRRMVSPPRPSRESITLSSICAQKGHFTGPDLLGGPRSRPPLLFRAPPSRAISPKTILHAPAAVHRQDCKPRK